VATIGMSLALWLLLILLHQPLARANLLGVVALAAICAAGGLAYAAFGTLLGVVRLSELRAVLRRRQALAPDSITPDAPGERL
jgi:methylthioribose-1-phosphate isomerase